MINEPSEIRGYERRPLPTLRDMAAIFFRQDKVIIIAFFAVIALVLLSGIWKRKYESHMEILALRQRTDAMMSAGSDAPLKDAVETSEEDLNSEVELLRADDLMRQVVLSTNLQNADGASSNRDPATAVATAVRKLEKKLIVEPIHKTTVISVKYESPDPQMAAKVLNAVAAAYMEKHREIHRPSGEFKFFDQQAERFEHELEGSQKQLTDFTRKNGVASAPLERDLALQRLADFDASANQAAASTAETAERVKSLQTQLNAMKPRFTTEVKSVENQQLMQQLKSTLLNLELKRTELLTKYDPSYRLVQEADAQIVDARNAIALEESKPVREETTDADPTYTSLRTEMAKAQADLIGLKARTQALKSVTNSYRATANNLVGEGQEQQDLERNEKSQEENYLLYQKKREEARISDALDQRGILNVAIVEQPQVPVFPKQSYSEIFSLTFLLALLVSLSAGLIADYLDPTFRTPDEVAEYLNIPVLATMHRKAS